MNFTLSWAIAVILGVFIIAFLHNRNKKQKPDLILSKDIREELAKCTIALKEANKRASEKPPLVAKPLTVKKKTVKKKTVKKKVVKNGSK